MTVIVAQVAVTSTTGPGLQLHWHGVAFTLALSGPSCSSSASKVTSRDALTWISWVMVKVRSAMLSAVAIMVLLWVTLGFSLLICSSARFLTLSNWCCSSVQMCRPTHTGADGFGVGAVVFVAAMAAHVNQTNASQYAKMLGHGRLVKG